MYLCICLSLSLYIYIYIHTCVYIYIYIYTYTHVYIQDEFAHLKRGARAAFLAEIQRAAADGSVPILLVDKINTMKQHRGEILEQAFAQSPYCDDYSY